MEETYGGFVPFYITEDQDWWDSCRYSGDREFVLQNEFVAVDTENSIEEQTLFRPNDIDACADWVIDNILVEGNQRRLLEVLSKMKHDNTLCFSWSW